MIDTYFASKKRSTRAELSTEIAIIRNSSIVTGLLNSVSGLLAILNEDRQILALNDAFMRSLGVEDPETALGLRPGEVLQCVHAKEDPCGCGTTKFCSSCGAAIAIVSALTNGLPSERICALSAKRDGKFVEMALSVRSQPIRINKHRFILLLVQDVTMEQRRAALERTFFHDINNLLGVLMHLGEYLSYKFPCEETDLLFETTERIHGEVAIQRYLSETEACEYRPMWQTCETKILLDHLKLLFANHPVAKDRNVCFMFNPTGIFVTTDAPAFSRILCNMITNALEADDKDGDVKVWVELNGKHVDFCVWNNTVIPEDVRLRIFQRNFSTKKQAGRGVGTFSMKFLGEEVLGGHVSFVSSKDAGTTFRFSHPVKEQNMA